MGLCPQSSIHISFSTEVQTNQNRWDTIASPFIGKLPMQGLAVTPFALNMNEL
jgi:hypothetical protein